jgi:superfamily II DNA or RNA helicase
MLDTLRASSEYQVKRHEVIHDAGSVLIEAPTGIGKTLMAAHTVARLAADRPMVWLWFAPFSSVVSQTEAVLSDETDNLRARDPHTDRAVEELRPGDVFISTWASVAVTDAEIRKTRSTTEKMPSLDLLIEHAKASGWYVGVVIDEAHHSFRGQSKAYDFFRTFVDPDLTLCITATPRDTDIEEFKQGVHLGNLRRIKVRRQEGVEAGLLKVGVKTAVFKAPGNVEELLNFKLTALQQGVAVHRRIKDDLAAAGIAMTPLLLVQVDSTENSEKEAITWLADLGFTKKQIMVHTAKEPDPLLNSVQGDDEVEVLIFKMAVALGFDAPRAFCLVSFRSSRDADFGLQIVGRLMRVDRRIQRVLPVAKQLMHGYVFLSDRDSQEGNAIKNELASLETSVDVIALSQNDAGLVRVENGQPNLPGAGFTLKGETYSGSTEAAKKERAYADTPFLANWGFSGDSAKSTDSDSSSYGKRSGTREGINHAEFAYPLKPDVPRSFTKAEVDVLSVDILQDILNRFRWDDSVLLLAKTDSRKILMENYEVFSHVREAPEEIKAKLLRAELDRRAQLCLKTADEDGFLDKRALYAGLMNRLAKEASDKGISGLESKEELEDGLAHILALRPDILPKAVSEAFAAHTVSAHASDLPAVLESNDALAGSRFNVYGVYPADLNNWERSFAERLDNDLSGTILWWHRNPVHKSHSVCMPVAGHGFFFPDFIVGVKGRSKTNGVILVEIKYQINDPIGNAAAKSRSRHPEYGNVLMLYLNEKTGEWMTVEYDEKKEQNAIDRVFREDLLVTY